MATQSNSKSSKAKSTKAPAAKAPEPVAKAAAPAVKPAEKVVAKPAEKPVSMPAPKAAKPVVPYEPTQEEIQTRAYEIYLNEGCKEGNDLEYWLRAESELRSPGAR